MSVISTVRTFLFKKVVLPWGRFKWGTFYGVHLGEGVRISRGARIDRTNPRGIHIGDHTAVTSGAAIIAHDFVNREWKDVHIGRNCFLGYGCVILPGVTVGDGCIIAVNTLVGRDVPPGCVVMGNPGKVVERDIVTGPWGIRLDRGNATPVAP